MAAAVADYKPEKVENTNKTFEDLMNENSKEVTFCISDSCNGTQCLCLRK